MKLSRWCPLVASISAVFLTTISTTAQANDDWWFDVEVIAFKRNVALTELEEQFSLADNLSAPRAQADIISDVIAPDISYLKQGLAICDAETTIKWPNESLFDVPSKDVDFLSLTNPTNAQNGSAQSSTPHGDTPTTYYSAETGSAYNNDSSQAGNTSSSAVNGNTLKESTYNSNQNNVSYSSADNSNSFDYSNEENAAGMAPDATTIASYWTSFFGVTRQTPISVPAFKYCEEPKPWLSAEMTTVINAVASSTSELNADAMAIKSTSKNSAVQPAIIWKVNKPDNRLPAPASLPIIIEGHDWPLASKAHLLTSNQQALSSISRQIRSSRELERLFHATWRQPVMFGKNKAFDVRLYGGQNYAQQFDLNGDMRKQKQTNALKAKSQKNVATEFEYNTSIDINGNEVPQNTSGTSEVNNTQQNGLDNFALAADATNTSMQGASELVAASDIFADLDRRLAAPKAIEYEAFKALDTSMIVEQDEDDATDASLRTPIWEIDGTIKVFLKYINRVPYLHVDGEMFYRQPVPLSYFSSEESHATSADQATPTEYKLVSVPLAEQRRVISTQLHYFDHPLFGFVVQVRRYKRPDANE